MTEFTEFDFTGAMGAEKAKEGSGGGNFARRVEFLSLKGDAAAIAQGKHQGLYRFVTDFQMPPGVGVPGGIAPDAYTLPWITANQHYAPTKPRPDYAREGQQWPPKMSGGCRKDKIFTAKFGGQCYLCDTLKNKPQSRTWALAVEREQVIENGVVIGVRDKTREVFAEGPDGKGIVIGKTDDGKDQYQMETAPAFVLMNMGWKNFFAPLNGLAQYFGTLLDADYVITRSGTENNDTVYSPIRLDPIMLGEGNEYGLPAGTKYDLTNRDLMRAVYPNLPDLRKIIAERVSEDYLGRWFLPGWAPPQTEGQTNGQQAPPQHQGIIMPGNGQPPAMPTPAGGATPPSGAMDALKNRVLAGVQQPQQ